MDYRRSTSTPSWPTAISACPRTYVPHMGSSHPPAHPLWIDPRGGISMSERLDIGPLQLGETAPNFVLDAITREGKIAIDDFRGEKPVLVGLYRGLHCSFCR